MPRRLAGFRKRTRHKMHKSTREKGKISLRKFFQKLELKDKVILDVDPAVHGGVYRLRFHNRVGTVVGKRGRCYEVSIKDGGKVKTLLVHPVHLRKQ